MKILVTGAAGFIGFHTCFSLIKRGDEVTGIDNINDYYDIELKKNRLSQLNLLKNFNFTKLDITDRTEMKNLFEKKKFNRVIHLAAQAGVRYSLENPYAYIESNILGFLNILEECRNNNIEHLVYASSSSVYGSNELNHFSEKHKTDNPVSLYGATKKTNEVMAHSYSHLYGLPTTGLRFFTVYGPWGRPDMSPFLFAKSILEEKPIKVFNYGKHQRDFTYIDDIVEGTLRVLDLIPKIEKIDKKKNEGFYSKPPYKIYNIGNNKPIELLYYIECLEKSLGKKAIKKLMPIQPGDVENTYADISELTKDTGYMPKTTIEIGIKFFSNWFKNYYI